MTYEPEERREHKLFGLAFTATNAEQRKVWLQLCRSPQSKRWGPLNSTAKLCDLAGHDPLTTALMQHLEDAEQAMTELAAKLIEAMEADRACN